MKRDFTQLVETWKRAYKLTLVTRKQWEARLKELQTWDKCNGHETERKAKVQALTELLEK